MTLDEAVQYLHNQGIDCRTIAGGIFEEIKTVRSKGDPYQAYFAIYLEGSNWATSCLIGQIPVIIKISDQLEVAVKAVCDLFRLKFSCSENIPKAFWSLQKSGLAAFLLSETEIRIQCTSTLDVPNVYDFMLQVFTASPGLAEYLLAWDKDESKWSLYDSRREFTAISDAIKFLNEERKQR